jgi:hypothetical protein
MINLFNIFFNIKSSIKPEDFILSRYHFILLHHVKKRSYAKYLETATLIDVNVLIQELFPKKIPKKVKIKLIDCVIMYIKYITINYDYYPGKKKLKIDFKRIIKLNFEKIASDYKSN